MYECMVGCTMYKLENILSGPTLFQKLNKLTLNTSCGISLPPATNTADKAVDEDKITNDKLILIFRKTFKREICTNVIPITKTNPSLAEIRASLHVLSKIYQVTLILYTSVSTQVCEIRLTNYSSHVRRSENRSASVDVFFWSVTQANSK